MRRRFEELAGATGLEPAASCVTGMRSNQLNYAPAWDKSFTFIIYAPRCRLAPSSVVQFPAVPSDRAVTGQRSADRKSDFSSTKFLRQGLGPPIRTRKHICITSNLSKARAQPASINF